MAKKNRLIHDSYLVRYLMATYPFGTYRLNVRLGKPTDEVLNGIPTPYKGLAQNYGLIADAVVVFEKKVIIIEAIIRPNEFWKLAQLNAYARYYRITESEKSYWEYPIEKVLLITDTNPLMISEAKHYGIKVVKWTTPDVENYKNTLFKWQANPRGTGLKPI